MTDSSGVADGPMVIAMTLMRQVGEILTTLEVQVWFEEKDVYPIADRICKKTYPGFYLTGYTRLDGHYYFVSKLID